MSYGWNAGDIVAASRLNIKLIQSVRNVGGAKDYFQELASELYGLLRALEDISDISSVRDNEESYEHEEKGED
ncbi:hypothetical protein VTL71DRAFT_10925 [Oculimacula yallundae]|uniref:Uncharacterized protein n=1 Tax=Oculimacula yallundae TaxID=86028 RepID=A0ABR4CUK0_9HELO